MLLPSIFAGDAPQSPPTWPIPYPRAGPASPPIRAGKVSIYAIAYRSKFRPCLWRQQNTHVGIARSRRACPRLCHSRQQRWRPVQTQPDKRTAGAARLVQGHWVEWEETQATRR
ncbi:hypothetical protein PAAG_11910 [Paracoccidioides lutzii Pb01]|uniref:Uncharacterized protein n=1 Tax=Paracoccidioides lutzii (strain ATCC MYA-826 / Pb01) TaxID=502779 RepID=A0A0A2V1F6_PARBA|nr:hypothetical protein PAAG_11910 [Paracoccidioides lutzii Pb01]KGQ01333.1 hypothetical protein PAAG_11910 [Paracoccidioides lutzii Pb01]